MASITRKCNWCNKNYAIEMTNDQMVRYEAWKNTGGHVQDYLPDLSADDRELLISGTCKKCWDKMFGEE